MEINNYKALFDCRISDLVVFDSAKRCGYKLDLTFSFRSVLRFRLEHTIAVSY